MASVRTTLALDDDVLAIARAIADRDRVPIGRVVSELARNGIPKPKKPQKNRNGIPILQRDEAPVVPVTLEPVNSLRDEEE